jgi:hypothetical protein
MRNSIMSVMRERKTPNVIDPAISAIVTIAVRIGSSRYTHQVPRPPFFTLRHGKLEL